MNAAWKRFLRLSGREKRDFFAGLFLLPLAALSLRVFHFRRIQRTMERWHGGGAPPTARNDAASFAEASASARMIEAASRHGLARGNCLSRSIALWWMLRRGGMPVELRIGARKEGYRFEAHAWVELDGRAVNDSEDVSARYAPFEGQITGEMVAQK